MSTSQTPCVSRRGRKPKTRYTRSKSFSSGRKKHCSQVRRDQMLLNHYRKRYANDKILNTVQHTTTNKESNKTAEEKDQYFDDVSDCNNRLFMYIIMMVTVALTPITNISKAIAGTFKWFLKGINIIYIYIVYIFVYNYYHL